MKARKLLLVIATIALLGTAVCAKDYKDVPDTHWAREQIAYLSDEIAGYPDGTFRPESTVTRAEFVTLLARTVFPEELKNETGDTWWKAAYRVCEANNLLSGSAGYNDAMPRGEIAQMLGYLCSDWGGVNARADAAEQFTINWNEQRMELPEPKPKAGRRKTPRLRQPGAYDGLPGRYVQAQKRRDAGGDRRDFIKAQSAACPSQRGL